MLSTETTHLIRYFLRKYPRRTAVLVVLLLLSGLAEGVGIMTLLPVVEIAMREVSDLSPISRVVLASLGSVGLPASLPVLLGLVVLSIWLKSMFSFVAMRQVGNTVAHIATDLRLDYIRALLRARWSFFVGERIGRVATAVSGEAMRAAGSYRYACSLFAAAVQAGVYMAVAFMISWPVAVMGMVGGGVLAMALGRLVNVGRLAGKKQTDLTRSLISRITDALQGIKPIKAMAREERLHPMLEAETRGINEAYRSQVFASEMLRTSQEPLLVFMLAIALYVAIGLLEQPFTAVMILAFLFYRLVGRIGLVQNQYQLLATSESAFDSIQEGIRSAQRAVEDDGGTASPTLEMEIAFRDVVFAYGARPVLKGVSFSIPAGQFVTIIGESGAGKTTIADLVVGLAEPQSGEILVDGRPLREIARKEWRKLLGYVPQDLFLFHDTLRRNITLGDPDITEAAVLEALDLAGARAFVEQLPDGLDTVLGERGSRLSGGQRQRIAIARALCGSPKLLILDEVTASLDPATEAALCQTLRELSGRLTILAISHQPALLAPADVIYRAVDGKVMPMTQPELSAASPE